jgi:hypothetical protein
LQNVCTNYLLVNQLVVSLHHGLWDWVIFRHGVAWLGCPGGLLLFALRSKKLPLS